MKRLFILCICLSFTAVVGQNKNETIPYEAIGDYPENYMGGNVVARFIDGLGYRYHWASKDLNQKDLAYRPSSEGRTALETLQHICNLSQTIVEATTGQTTVMPQDFTALTYDQLRLKTLTNFATASKAIRDKTAAQVQKLEVVFKRGDNTNRFPYWNIINGPIADAIYHTGQVVMLRRASGNPISNKVNVFLGKNGS